MAIAVEPPRDRSTSRVGHVLAAVAGALGATAAWLARRAYIAIPLATLTFAPLVIADDSPFDSMTERSLELAPGAAPQAEATTQTTTRTIDEEPIAQLSRKPRPRTAPRPAPPPPPPPHQLQQQPGSAAPTPNELANLYVTVARELTTATKRDPSSTVDLWPRFRWIRVMDALRTPTSRAEAAALLERLDADVKALTPP